MNLKLSGLGNGGYLRLRKKTAQPKIVQVKAGHFNRLKALSAVAVCVTIALAFSVIRISGKSEEEIAENTRLQTQISALQTQIDKEAVVQDSMVQAKNSSKSQAATYIESIQSKLSKINNYLQKRGLNSISFKRINTDGEKKPLSDSQLYNSYDNYLSRLVADVSLIPMGYPKISSLTSFFGYRSNPFDFGASEFHPGIDFKGRVGDLVKCTASGKVVFTGRAGGYGNCIKIKHTNNLETWYGHLSHIGVREGQKVNAGDVIGRVGSTGRSTGPHLHYEVRKNGQPVNPVQYLSLM